MDFSATLKRLSFYLAPFTLGAWGIIFLHSYFSGQTSALLHPLFRPLVLTTGFILLFLSVAALFFLEPVFAVDRSPPPQSVKISDSKWGALRWLILLLPILWTAAYAPNQFSADALEARGLDNKISLPDTSYSDDDAQRLLQAISQTAPAQAIELSIQDLITAATVPTVAEKLNGRIIQLTGQFHHQNAHQFKIMRLFMFCCAADAVPIFVDVDGGVPNFKEMDWIQLKGIVHFTKKEDQSVPELNLVSVEASAPPDDPYIY